MKKCVNSLFIIVFIFVLSPLMVNASGSISISTGSISMNTGGSSSFTVRANNAVGRVDISSSNPSVASVSSSSVFLDNNSQPVTVRAGNAGSAVITVKCIDCATYDSEVLSNTFTINVNVKAPSNNTNTRPVNPSTNNTNSNNNYNNSNNSNNVQEDKRSSDNTLKSIDVVGYKLETKDNANYYLTVKNSIDKVTIKAVVNESHAKVDGVGNVSLKVGENKFDLVVTAENGSTKKYSIFITRKDNKYSINELSDAISEVDDQIITIILKDNDTISKDILNKMKSSGKTFKFIKNGDNKSLLYSWEINSKKINSSDSINMNISFKFDSEDKFNQIIDYRNGVYINFTHDGNVPKNTKVSINVKDKYKNGDNLKLYYYDEEKDKVILMEDEVIVKDGIAEFEIDHCSKYFLTKANIISDSENNPNSIIFIIIMLVVLVIAGIIVFIFKNGNKNVSSINNTKTSNNQINNDSYINPVIINNEVL